jgi:hypothetical protein
MSPKLGFQGFFVGAALSMAKVGFRQGLAKWLNGLPPKCLPLSGPVAERGLYQRQRRYPRGIRP